MARLPSYSVPDQYMLVSYGPVRTEDFSLTVETYCIFCIVLYFIQSEDPVTGLITKYKKICISNKNSKNNSYDKCIKPHNSDITNIAS